MSDVVLINYSKVGVGAEQLKKQLAALTELLKHHGLKGVASNKDLTIQEYLDLCRTLNSKGYKVFGSLIANEATLANLTGHPTATLDDWRGSRLEFSPPAIILAPLHQLWSVPYGKWLAKKDIGKLKQLNKPVTQMQFSVVDPSNIARCYHRLENSKILSIDIETNKQNQITCISFCGLDALHNGQLVAQTWVIPFIDFGVNHWESAEDYGKALQLMRDLCELPMPKLFQNGLYDVQLLIPYGAYPVNWTLDTMALTHAEFSELPRSLDFITSLHCYDYIQWKHESERSYKEHDVHGFWRYCALDSWNTLRCVLSIFATAPAYTYTNYKKLFPLVYPSIYAAFEGILVDEEKRLEIRAEASVKIESSLANLRTMAATKEFNPGSTKQLGILLYDILGAATPARTKARATDKKALSKIATQHPILARFVEDIVVYRKNSKSISTYCDAVLLNQRLLWSINPFGTDTGRLSSKKSSFRTGIEGDADKESYGAQVQNQPPYFKKCLRADEGYVLVEFDASKSEARCVAYLAQCEKLIQALEDELKDFYKQLGTMFFQIPYEEISEDFRNSVLKKIQHGTNYMMKEFTFIDTVGPQKLYEAAAFLGKRVDKLADFARYLLEIYHHAFPELSEKWYPDIKARLRMSHKLVSPLGYTRYFFGDPENMEVLRSAVAHEPQQLSVEIINKSLWKLYNQLVLLSNGAVRFKAQIHDSIFFQVLEKYLKDVLAAAKELSHNPVKVHGRTMVIPVEFKVGTYWGDLKKWKE